MSAIYTHSDREEVRRRAEPDFIQIFEEHGGRRRGKMLFCTFHKNQNTPAASIHKGWFRCFGCGLSLDIFGFVERAQGVDFKTALAYLAERYGIPLQSNTLTDTERREYAERRTAAERKAARLVAWRNELLFESRDRRHGFLRAFHRSKSHVIHCGKLAECCEVAMDAAELYERAYQDLDVKIATVASATWDQLTALWLEIGGPTALDVAPMEWAV